MCLGRLPLTCWDFIPTPTAFPHPWWISYLFPSGTVPWLCWIHTAGFGVLLLPSGPVPLHPQEAGNQGRFISVGLFLD